jgi:murein DD-endopeptidase MepM/ murein hydrolase activator NlpD
LTHSSVLVDNLARSDRLTEDGCRATRSDTAGNRQGVRERAIVNGERRVIPDYKPLDRPKRPGKRLPWFAAGLGIPLLAFALMSPPSKPTLPDAKAPAGAEAASAPELPASDPAAPASAATVPAALPATDPATPDPAAAPAGTELTLTVRRGDSLDRLFARNDLSRADLAGLVATELGRKHLRIIRPGDKIMVRHEAGQVLSLRREVGLTETLLIERGEDGFAAQIIAAELERRPLVASGTISNSLFLAAADAGISDRTIMNLAGIFAWDVDFVLDIREGDQFRLVYEELWRNGELLGEGDILAAEFVNQGQSYRAIRFADPQGRVDYYTPEGRSVRKAFVRAPLSFTRVSSNFNPRRRHPKLNTIRAHRGVDYAAPTGTPVKAAGDGKVSFRGRKGGYGNTVILQHGGNITTLYAHLSRFGKFRGGQRVRQGQVIGYVGATGLATGPHLHYEYRANGVHRNPRTVKLPDAEPIDPAYLTEFRTVADRLLERLQSGGGVIVARAGAASD